MADWSLTPPDAAPASPWSLTPPEAPPAPAWSTTPPAESPGIFGALTAGVKAGAAGAFGDWGKSIQATFGVKPQPEAAPTGTNAALAAPFQLAMPDANTIPKLVYQTTEGLVRGVPSIAAFVTGSAIGGGPEEPVGLATGAIAAGATSAFQSFGPYWAQALKDNPGDPSKAWDSALTKASIDGAINAASFRLFSLAPFKSNVMNLAFQTLGVQPAAGLAGAEAQALTEGKNITPGQAAQTFIQSAVGTAVPFAGHALLGRIMPDRAAMAETPPVAPEAAQRAPQAPAAAPAGPLPALEPGAVVGVKGPGGEPMRAAVQQISDGLVHWIGEDNVPRVDDLAAFRKDMAPAPPPAQPIGGDATTVPTAPPRPAGEPPIEAPDQFAQAFREGVPRVAEPVQPPPPPSPQGAIPLADTTAIDANLRAAATYRVNAEKARIAGSKSPEQIGDMERMADMLEGQAQDLRAKLAAPRTVPTDVTLPAAPVAPAAAETLLTRAPGAPGPEPTFGPPTLEGQMGELGRAAPAESVATTGAEPVMGTKPKAPETAPEIAPGTATKAPEFSLEPPAGPAPRPAAAEKPEDTLLQFLAKKGLKDEGGELAAMDLSDRGRGRYKLIRKGGMDWDEAVVQAQQAGYIGEGAGLGAQVGPESVMGTKAELLDKIRAEAGGQKQYPIGREPVAEFDAVRDADMREMAAEADRAKSLRADLASMGETDLYHLDASDLQDRLDERLASIGVDDVATARSVLAAEQAAANVRLASDAPFAAALNAEDTKGEFNAGPEHGIPSAEQTANAAPGAEQAPPLAAPEVAGAGAAGNQAPGTAAEGRPRAPAVEKIPTVEGPREHYVLPGMEQSAIQAQAARDVQRGMTSTAPQKALNEGLFAPVETDTQQVIPGVSGQATAKAVDPGSVATGLKAATKNFGDMLKDDSGGVPRREKVLTDAERIAAEVKASQPTSLKSITGMAQHTALAQTIAEKDPLGAHYMAARQDRNAARHAMQFDAQKAGGDWLRAPEAVQTKINKVLEYQTMTGRDIQDTGRPVVVHYDAARDFPGRPNPLQIIKDGETVRLSPPESRMLHGINDFMDRAWKQMAEADARKFGYQGSFLKVDESGRLQFDTPAIQAAIDGATDKGIRTSAERAMGFAQEAQNTARKGYFPLMRYGDWTITVTPKVPAQGLGHALRDEGWFSKVESQPAFGSLTGFVKGTDLNARPKLVSQEMAKLKQRFPGEDYNMVARRQEPKTAQTVDLAMVDRVLSDTKLTDPTTGERLSDQVLTKLYDDAKASYRQRREGIPGYSTDFARAYSDYARQWSGVVSEKLHGDNIRQAYDATQLGSDKRAAKYWEAYAAHNDKPQPWVYGAMRRVGFFNYLWGSPSSAMIQLTQTPLITGTQLGMLVGHTRAQYMVNSMLTRAALGGGIGIDGRAGLTAEVKNFPGITAAERAALTQADKEGRLNPVLPTDFAGGQFSPEMRRRFAPAVRVYDMGASAFNTADRLNRMVSWVSAYRAAQMPGMAARAARIYRDDALYREQVGRSMDPAKFANWFTNETQFLSGREGSSPLMRNVGSVAFQFQHYNTNMLRVMRKNLTKMGPEGKAAFGVMLTGLVLGAGLGGLPFVNDAERIANQVGKWVNDMIDPRLDAQFRGYIADSGFAKMAAGFFGTDPLTVAEATTEGLSRSLLGLDLGRRIGLGNILPGNTDLLTAVPFLDATVGKVEEAYKRAQDSQTMGAIAALLPAAAANPLKAFGSWPNEGINPQAGGVPYFKASEVTPQMQAARALGFQPATLARRQESMNDRNAINFATDAAQKQLVKAVSDNYGRSISAQQAGDMAGAQSWAAKAEALLRDNAERLADPNIPAWQQIPQPMAKALKSKIAMYLMDPTLIRPKTNKMKVGEMLNSPFLSQ